MHEKRKEKKGKRALLEEQINEIRFVMSNNFKKLISLLISNRESTCEKLQPKILKIIHCTKLHVFIAMGVIIKSRCKYLKMITNEGSFRGVCITLYLCQHEFLTGRGPQLCCLEHRFY
jgi:hypothetical protein